MSGDLLAGARRRSFGEGAGPVPHALVRGQPRRIQLRRTKDWRKPEGAIVVSRPSKWGNPFVVRGTEVLLKGVSEWLVWSSPSTEWAAREIAVTAFRGWLNGRYPGAVILAARRDVILRDLAELAGHDVACWCKPGDPCHGDELLEMANPNPEA